MKPLLIVGLLMTLANTAMATTLIHNIQGYTMNEGKRVSFVAMAYDAGKVQALYHDQASLAGVEADERIDGGGATLLPGLIDAHGHITGHGFSLVTVDLVGAASEADALKRVADYIADAPSQGWINGRGWNQVLWPGQAFPTRSSLDTIAPERPVVLRRVDGHAIWVNSAALRLAGITRDSKDPAGGEILRDDDGEPTGVLIDNAAHLITALQPPLNDQQMLALETRALTDLASYGLTSVHEARTEGPTVRAYQTLRDQQALPIRVYAMLHILDPDIERYLEAGPSIDEQHMLDVRAVKISADGALGSRGAALFEDYSDLPGHRGLLLYPDDTLKALIGRAMKAGYQVNTHAIGDLANARVLDYYEQQIQKTDSRALRHRIEHAQVLRPGDLPRLATAGIIASVQPLHATSDKNMAGDRLGNERLSAGAYAWKTLLDSGAAMAAGSDFPVESPNPFYGLHAAVTRQDHANNPAGGWLPSQKLTRDQALSLFTEGAAYAAHQELRIGRLLPGYFADFILVRDDYFKVAEQDIWNNRVLATFVAGKQVFSSSVAP